MNQFQRSNFNSIFAKKDVNELYIISLLLKFCRYDVGGLAWFS